MKNEPKTDGFYKVKYQMDDHWTVIKYENEWVFNIGVENGTLLWVANKHVERWGSKIKMPGEKLIKGK